MCRTKRTNNIKNALCRHFQTDLREDFGDNKFNVLIDESSDMAVLKLLGISIVYHSNSERKVVPTYLGLVELEACDAEHMVQAIKTVLNQNEFESCSNWYG